MRIRNGSNTLEVTKGAFREIYSHLGWTPDVEPEDAPAEGLTLDVEDTPNPAHNTHLEDEPGAPGEENFEYESEETEDELEEKPISLMSFEELKEYAARLNIDTTGLRSKKEVRLLIKRHI